jgi:hypothetical protein
MTQVWANVSLTGFSFPQALKKEGPLALCRGPFFDSDLVRVSRRCFLNSRLGAQRWGLGEDRDYDRHGHNHTCDCEHGHTSVSKTDQEWTR